MTGHRRNFIAGGSFFFTVNLAERHSMRGKAMGFARAYMRLLVSRDISVVFSDLVALVTDWDARSSPAAAMRCAEGAGLEGASQSVTLWQRSPIFC